MNAKNKMLAGLVHILPYANVSVTMNPLWSTLNFSPRLSLPSSAARFGDLEPFGRFFEPFGAQYFDLAILKFGSFLGFFFKNCQKKNGLNGF